LGFLLVKQDLLFGDLFGRFLVPGLGRTGYERRATCDARRAMRDVVVTGEEED
jgi:hypothetical protein